MDRLRPVEDVWDELSVVEVTDEGALGIIQADREAMVQRCADAAHEILAAEGFLPGTRHAVTDAILGVAKPSETEREQLGRKCWNARRCERDYKWEDLPELEKEAWREIAAAVCAELDKIREEQKL